ncbi:MAG TPA: hypothetical protein VMR34_04495 [Candidatus Saccharimonadales bacterium]|nr:hypothetical protein [Candidatus Saccharimonadales bacterium]
MSDHETGSGQTPPERLAQLIDGVTLRPGMSAVDYARVVTSHQDNWVDWQGLENGPGAFTDAVNQSFSILFANQPPEDIKAAKAAILDYSERISDRSRGDFHQGRFFSWIVRLKGLTKNSAGASQGLRVYDEEAPQEETFWADIYSYCVNKPHPMEALGTYVLGPEIEQKNPTLLASVLERLEIELPSSVFGDKALSVKTPETLVRLAYDCFNRLVVEASDAGWRNAAIVQALRGKLAAQNHQFQYMINKLGNQVTTLINRFAVEEDGRQLEFFDLTDRYTTTAAIDRCMYLIFDLGSTPEGHDPLNFRLTAQIIVSLIDESNRLLDEAQM